MALRTWSKPTQTKATVEDADDPVLGWTAQYTNGPDNYQAYAPWRKGVGGVSLYKFTKASDIVDPTAAPTAATATTGGTLPAATYVYAYSWAEKADTLPSPTVSQATTGTTSTVTVTVPSMPAWATKTNVYRQVSGTLRLVGSTTTTTFVDDGSVDPTNAAAAQTSGPSKASYYVANH